MCGPRSQSLLYHKIQRGLLTIISLDGQLHAIPHSRDDSDILAQERRANGLSGQSLVELCEGSAPQDYPCVHPQLAWLHRVLIETWHDTGRSAIERGDIPDIH